MKFETVDNSNVQIGDLKTGEVFEENGFVLMATDEFFEKDRKCVVLHYPNSPKSVGLLRYRTQSFLVKSEGFLKFSP